MNFILNKKLKYYTKEILRYFNIIVIAVGIIVAVILVKYKLIYKIKILGEEIGYIENKQAFKDKIIENIEHEGKEKNIEDIYIKNNPEYELKLVDRKTKTNEEEIVSKVEQDIIVTYKYCEVNLNNEAIDAVDTVEEAEELVEQIRKDNQDKELNLSIVEKYTENEKEINTTKLEVAKNNIQEKLEQKIKEQEYKKQEEERINNMPEINGIKLAYVPLTGIISSRYASIESVRNSRSHTGLDIAAPIGTNIKVIASGTVTCASNQGGYGNIVKIDHGNGLETYYAHCSKLYVKKGQYVEAGTVIAAVGSTGNSTGAHLHLEIRVNGKTVNPQNYLYK